MEFIIYYYYLLLCLPLLYFLIGKKPSKRLPPGSLGIPVIGQSFDFLQAMRANKVEEWFQERIRKYGPISKLRLFGTPTVFLHGQAANKFLYTCSDKILSSQQPASVRRIVGERNIFELSGEDHKRVRGTLLSFMKPEALKQSTGQIDEEIKLHLDKHWHGKKQIVAMPLMKTLTFNIICSTLFGIERGTRRDTLVDLFDILMEGLLSFPINLPFTRYNRSLHARSKIRHIILELIHEKREKLRNREILDHHDLITYLLSVLGKTNMPLFSDEEIVDNCIVTMIGGHDTTSILLSFLIKLLAENPDIYRNVLSEHEEIARGKSSKDLLTWEDLTKMKYTWRVATESMRMNPPVFSSYRKVLQEFEIGGYVIPKGWQVIWAGCMTHMDKSIFADPLKFDPSRFENQVGIPSYSFIAFGGGPRMCPGYEFARIETLTLIHYLVTGFEWKLCFEENLFAMDPMPVFKNGLPLNVELKKPTDHVL